jgi:hypothetical protein
MATGIIIGLISLLGVVAVYFWVVRRGQQQEQK